MTAAPHVGEQRDLAALASGSGCSLRHSSTSGWMPMLRSSLTECWVGLVFSSPAAAMYGHQGQVHEHHLVRAALDANLADGFEERQRFDVADGAADLDQAHVETRRWPRRCSA
jgi:hypothetical protein